VREIVLGLVPGSILFYRYAPGLRIAQITGILLMEVAPYVVIAVVGDFKSTGVFWGFVTLYSIYELGYLHNDMRAARRESAVRTVRSQFDGFRIGMFLLVRIPVFLGILWMCLRYTQFLDPISSMALLLVVIVLFLIHNALRDGKLRVATFIALNSTKILYRIIIFGPGAVAFFPAAIPHLMVKLMHYLRAKELVAFNDPDFGNIKLGVYSGWLVSLGMLDWKVALVVVPYFLNHCKAGLYSWVLTFGRKV
jgi:hypothetical protein